MGIDDPEDSWFTSFEEAGDIGQHIAYSTLIFFFLLSLFLNYSPYPASLSSDVLSSEFASRVMEFPFVETRYNQMQAYDGVSGDKYIISTVYAIYLAVLFAVIFFFQYLVFVVFMGKMVRRGLSIFFRTVCFFTPVITGLWAAMFLLPLRDSSGAIVSSALVFTWPVFPVLSTVASIFLSAAASIIASGFVKLVLLSFRGRTHNQ